VKRVKPIPPRSSVPLVAHLARRGQKGEEIPLRRHPFGDAAGLLPRAVPPAPEGFAVLHLHFHAAGRVQHAAAIQPEGHVHGLVAQVALTFQVDGLLFAAAPGIAWGSQGDRGLDHIRGVAIAAQVDGALPGCVHLLVGSGRGEQFGGLRAELLPPVGDLSGRQEQGE
jgi:hypothetical protein